MKKKPKPSKRRPSGRRPNLGVAVRPMVVTPPPAPPAGPPAGGEDGRK